MSLTLQQAFNALEGLYGPRNTLHLRGEAALRLLARIRKAMYKDIRKGCLDPAKTARLTASLLAHTWSYANTFGKLPFVQELARKYPSCGCAYCGRKPCQCALGVRADITVKDTIDEAQLHWTLTQWINHFDDVYGVNNRTNGIAMAMMRLDEELCEVDEVVTVDLLDSRLSADEQRTRIAHEFADAIAWTFALAVVTKTSSLFEVTFEELFCGVCDDCNNRPCQCGSAFLKRARRPTNKKRDRRSPDGTQRADTV